MMMNKMRLISVVLFAALCTAVAQDNAIKPPAPRSPGPPPLPLESDVLRYVFEHFPERDRDEVMSFIGVNFKSELPEFRKLAKEDAPRAAAYMIDLVNDALALMNVAEKDKQLAQMMIRQKDLERKAERMAQKAALADGDEKESLKKELRSMLVKAFDAKQQLMQRDLAGMESELKKLSEMIIKREKYREQIIDKKLSELTEEADYMKW